MIKKLLIYNSGGGIGDSIQLLSLINTLKSELKNTKFYYLSAHNNHFNSTLKDFNCQIQTLDLKRPIYQPLAAYGHLGREGFSWEKTDKIDQLKTLAMEETVNG